MNRYYNLPPGVTPRMIDGDPDRVSYDEQVRQWFCDHREVPCDAPTEDYVWNRIASDDEPGPDEVLRWIEKQVVAGNLDPVEDAPPVQLCKFDVRDIRCGCERLPDNLCADCLQRGFYHNACGTRFKCGLGDPVDDMAHEPRDRTQPSISPSALYPYSGCPGCGNRPCTCPPL